MDSITQNKKLTILIVDDCRYTLSLISDMLISSYNIRLAKGAEKALKVATSNPIPDLIILDIRMPEMNGFQLCEILKATEETRDIPIIFLTSYTSHEKERQGLELGAVDFIRKPPRQSSVLARIRNHLELKVENDILRAARKKLELEVLKKSCEVASAQDSLISSLAIMAGARDIETGKHILRTQLYIKYLALQLQNNPRFGSLLDSEYVERLYQSAPLHDIGKIGIPDHILLKKGRLTLDEFEVMKTHPDLGRSAIEAVQSIALENFGFLDLAKEIAYGHHEKWDGSGYPKGLIGDAIPVSARLMSIVDVYDALTSRRPYKEPMSHMTACEIILNSKGSHFDPDMVDAFESISDVFEMISLRHMDSEEDIALKRT